ncbi:L-threonylcarbamoyladenylate synthase [Alkalinema sp. FACHB-956]|uniref:L-threonylcarbamoyladenylate synthase n=1 Tax=Alkalinema sp. FACHB-956 TaxID=2692768 RepID=UPI00168210A1|nr:L-threonylcarbamoyladenylate synthase [Alkalinema sp. FACHB-956]MBD2330127.1 L-threonylcarbamoyladenylate synthase [Alkalinema sp. FACHB-956]
MPSVALSAFLEAARSGQHLLSFPTDTVPALAAKPEAAPLIYQAKERSFDKPLILMAGDMDDLWPYLLGSETDRATWQQTMEHYFPGALTLVLPASDRVPPQMNPRSPGTIGVRVPDNTVARSILRQTGPLATTSVNKSGQPALLDLTTIAQEFPEVFLPSPDALAELQATPADLTASGIPSTVIRWTGTTWEVLRQGAIVVPIQS